jgi:hypothetical protein
MRSAASIVSVGRGVIAREAGDKLVTGAAFGGP